MVKYGKGSAPYVRKLISELWRHSCIVQLPEHDIGVLCRVSRINKKKHIEEVSLLEM
jgi:hypothetical protein